MDLSSEIAKEIDWWRERGEFPTYRAVEASVMRRRDLIFRAASRGYIRGGIAMETVGRRVRGDSRRAANTIVRELERADDS